MVKFLQTLEGSLLKLRPLNGNPISETFLKLLRMAFSMSILMPEQMVRVERLLETTAQNFVLSPKIWRKFILTNLRSLRAKIRVIFRKIHYQSNKPLGNAQAEKYHDELKSTFTLLSQ